MMLSVDAIATVNNQDLGRTRFVFREEGLSWVQSTAAYSQIHKYGTTSDKLYVQFYDGKQDLSINLTFIDQNEFIAALEILLDHVNVDPLHHNSTKLPDRSHNIVETLFVRTHVTFLHFAGDSIIAGVGDRLQIFRKLSGWQRSVTRQIFRGQHIHGVRLQGDYMIVYGGRRLSYVKQYKTSVRVVYSFQAPDWVLDCKWLKESQAVVLTANNAIILYNVRMHKVVAECVRCCVERCILYSGSILGDCWDNVVVLAGTVFSTIVIWSNCGESQNKEIIQRLEGHKGVIFSVTFCDANRRICSTSDDRTVRIWDVLFEKIGDWKTCAITLKFTLYGHSARVWKSFSLETGQIVSIGEDSKVCLWSADGNLETQFGHQDGEIWSLSVSEKLQLIATGGSDGGVNLWPIKKAPTPHKLQCTVKPKCVGLLGDGRPFMVSWSGDVFLYRESWELHLSEPDLKSYCVHAVSPNRQLLAFASITGTVIICRVGNSVEQILNVKVHDGRIYSLIWPSIAILVVCFYGAVSVLELSSGCQILNTSTFTLPPSKERWVTSCSVNDTHVVCGDRCGSLHLYRIGQSNPVHSLKKIHGLNGVTDLKHLNGAFVSTGRDGTCREFVVENDRLVMLRCHKLKMDWAAAVLESGILGRVVMCFHELSLVIWNVRNRQEIVKINCGGGHRSWDCVINGTQCVATFIKGSSVYYCCIPLEDILCFTLLPASHAKAINAGVSLSEWILFGGEDTTLRLVSAADLTEIRVLQSHLSSVRAVAYHQSAFDGSGFVASGGGRGQLVFWKVRAFNTVDIVELTSYSVISDVSDVAEMRIMDLQIYQLSRTSILIAGGCSDGTLRIFTYSFDSKSISELQSIDCQNCLLTVRLALPFLLATTTSGTLFFYSIDASGLLTNPQSFPVAQTGLNSCDFRQLTENFIVACSGDDALVNILLFDSTNLLLTDKWVHDAAHTCQVSGLKIVDDLILTVGLDQKLTVFSFRILGKRIQAEIIEQIDLCIPDAHGLLAWQLEPKCYSILVYGLGTQLVKFSCQ